MQDSSPYFGEMHHDFPAFYVQEDLLYLYKAVACLREHLQCDDSNSSSPRHHNTPSVRKNGTLPRSSTLQTSANKGETNIWRVTHTIVDGWNQYLTSDTQPLDWPMEHGAISPQLQKEGVLCATCV